MKSIHLFLVALFNLTIHELSTAQGFTNHTYQAISGEFTWHQAKVDAESRGGHLATINSQAEFDYVASLGVLPPSGYWLGATDAASEGVWVWVTGEPVEFSRWIAGEPNNAQGVENYLIGEGSFFGHHWKDVADVADTTIPYYLLEIDQCSPRKARANAQLVNGFVVGASITDGGCGYTNAPVIQIQGGGGNGATARAVITDGRVTDIIITDAGIEYTTTPRIVIASPPFVPSLAISVNRVRVVQNVVLGRNYVLESSHDTRTWDEAMPRFMATSESITNEFDVDVNGRFFRVREVP